MVIASQCGKTEALFDIIGERLDTSPVPIIFLGPTKQMLEEQLEPRITELLTTTCLKSRMAPAKKQRLTKKVVCGVPLRLAHGGSSTALKSDPFGLAVTDEADELIANVKGSGSPIELVDDRGNTYSDFVHAVISTPSEGNLEVEYDEESGLEFWADSEPEDLQSTIWRLWQSGTKYHWAMPCPECDDYFIPRFSCLKWEKPVDEDGRELSSTTMLAEKTAYLECPRCGGVIEDEKKEQMNARGVFVAPGQTIDQDGNVIGLPPESWTISYWVSGLASPFVTWGERAARYVTAVRSGDPEAIRAVKNGGFAELYAPGGGAAPDWKEVRDCASEYAEGEFPDEASVATLCADVQKDMIYYTVRGWGSHGTSWLIESGRLYGETSEKEIWEDLANLVTSNFDGVPLRLALIDSGFRPGKPFIVPEHRVYSFARRFPKFVYATKGSSTSMRKPIVKSKVDVRLDGKEYKKGLELLRLDTDYLKSWVQQRVRWEKGTPGAWYIGSDTSDDYCKQIVSEARIVAPGGKHKWVQKSRENHFLDCEAMQGACFNLLNLATFRGQKRPDARDRRNAGSPNSASSGAVLEKPKRNRRKSDWLDNGSIW
jgi:phage terminase large subunit GpA-like protein